MTTYLTRDAILGVQDIRTETVDVPEWGGAVLVRGMSGVERNQYELSIVQEVPSPNKRQARAGQTITKMDRTNIVSRLCTWCIVDGNGNRVFNVNDIELLATKSAAALERVSDVAMRLSGMTDDDVEELAQAMVEDPFDETSSP